MHIGLALLIAPRNTNSLMNNMLCNACGLHYASIVKKEKLVPVTDKKLTLGIHTMCSMTYNTAQQRNVPAQRAIARDSKKTNTSPKRSQNNALICPLLQLRLIIIIYVTQQ